MVRVRPNAISIHVSEQNEHITNMTPVEDIISPIPTSGETIPPAAKQTAPRSADAVPELSR